MHDAEQFANAPGGPAFFLEPAQVFDREVEQRGGPCAAGSAPAVFSEGHERPGDVAEVGLASQLRTLSERVDADAGG